jgi:hypothetical protein
VPLPPAAASSTSASGTPAPAPFSSPRNTLSSTSGVLVAFGDASQPSTPRTPPPPSSSSSFQTTTTGAASGVGLPFDEEAKLVYGVILSLQNMVKRLSGRCVSHLTLRPLPLPLLRLQFLGFSNRSHACRDESFVSYRTSTYKLHLFETVSGYRFVMLSDPNAESLRFVMRSIYTGPFLEYVVRNPLVPMDSRERGIDNEYFRASIDRLVRGLSIFQ